jgi:hypothetical protein
MARFTVGGYPDPWYEARVGKPDEYSLDPPWPEFTTLIHVDFETGEITEIGTEKGTP